MNYTNFYTLKKEEKQRIFQQVSAAKGIPQVAIEKDWWVVVTLSIIFQMDVAPYLVFKCTCHYLT
jgi:hypothetical protein